MNMYEGQGGKSYLEHDLLPRAELGSVHLRHASGRERLGVDVLELLADTRASSELFMSPGIELSVRRHAAITRTPKQGEGRKRGRDRGLKGTTAVRGHRAPWRERGRGETRPDNEVGTISTPIRSAVWRRRCRRPCVALDTQQETAKLHGKKTQRPTQTQTTSTKKRKNTQQFASVEFVTSHCFQVDRSFESALWLFHTRFSTTDPLDPPPSGPPAPPILYSHGVSLRSPLP